MKASFVLALAALLLQASLCGADSTGTAVPAGMSCDDRVPTEVGAWASDPDVNMTGRELGWLSGDTCSTCATEDRCPTLVQVDETGTIISLSVQDYSRFDGLFDCIPGGKEMTMLNSTDGSVSGIGITACSVVPTGALWLLVAIGGLVVGVPLAFSGAGVVTRLYGRLMPKKKPSEEEGHDHAEHGGHGGSAHSKQHSKRLELMGDSGSPISPKTDASSPESSVRSGEENSVHDAAKGKGAAKDKSPV